MGLSVAIAGGIVIFTIVYAMMSFPAILDDATKVSMASSQMSNTVSAILHTNLSVQTLANIHGTNTVRTSVTNTGNTILWNYNKFDVIVTYQAVGGATVTEPLQYTNSCAGIANGQWCINSITNDLVHQGMLDPKETANIQAQLSQLTNLNAIVTLNFGTDNGIVTSDSVTAT